MSRRRSVSSPVDKYLSAWLVIAGLARLYLGNDDKAVTCFRRSVETDRNHPAAQYYLAPAHWRSSVGWRKLDLRFERLWRSRWFHHLALPRRRTE